MKQVIPRDYQPNDEVLARLAQCGVDREFALSLVLEFVIYWQERGDTTHSWSSKFVTHAMHEWRRYEIMLAQGRAHIAMHIKWFPNQNVLWAIAEQKIPEAFVLSVLPEFRIYWMDQGLVTNAWNSKFIGHVRYRWQTRSVSVPSHVNNKPTRQHSLVGDITDRSWAAEYTGGRKDGNR